MRDEGRRRGGSGTRGRAGWGGENKGWAGGAGTLVHEGCLDRSAWAGATGSRGAGQARPGAEQEQHHRPKPRPVHPSPQAPKTLSSKALTTTSLPPNHLAMTRNIHFPRPVPLPTRAQHPPYTRWPPFPPPTNPAPAPSPVALASGARPLWLPNPPRRSLFPAVNPSTGLGARRGTQIRGRYHYTSPVPTTRTNRCPRGSGTPTPVPCRRSFR